jgi:DNA-binding winged helix-turn-helix (wHTH) protein
MRYVFGEYELDTQTYELRQAGTPLQIEPQAFKVLAYLIQHHHRTVTRQELLEHLWPEPFTSEAVLSYCIMTARKAVGDSGRVQRVIKTIHGRGFRFIATLQQDAHEPRNLEASAASAVAASASQPVSRPEGAPDHPNPQVTVLCATLADVASLSERLGFDTLQRLRQAFFTLAQDTAQQYRGSLRFFGADGVLILFGVLHACEGHARQAVQAAMDLQWRLCEPYSDAATRQTVRHAMRTGLHTGPMAVDRIPDDRRLAATEMGETAHLAVWLQYLAEPGTLLISEATIRQGQDAVQDAVTRDIHLPGHTEPMQAYVISPTLWPSPPMQGKQG